MISAGSRVRARIKHSVGNASCLCKIYYVLLNVGIGEAAKITGQTTRAETKEEQRDIRVPTQTLPAGMHIHFSFNLRTRDSIIFYVESEFPVNTYVVDQTGLDNFKQGLQFTYYGGFLNQTIHRNRVRIPFAGIWYFIIDNPSTYQSTAIHYEVS